MEKNIEEVLSKEAILNLTEQKGSTFKDYILSRNQQWFWLIIAVSLVSAIVILVIPEDVYIIRYVRAAFGIILLLFVPGFTLKRLILLEKEHIPLNSRNVIGLINPIAISVGLSLVLIVLISLVLTYSPWGLTLAPIIFLLLSLSISFAMVALIREYHSSRESQGSIRAEECVYFETC